MTRQEYIHNYNKRPYVVENRRSRYLKKHPNARKYNSLTKEEMALARKKRSKEFYDKNKKIISEYHKKYLIDNRPLLLARRHKFYIKLRSECISYYSNNKNCCDCCGESILDFLAIDHINGKGSEHRKSINVKGGYKMCAWLKRNNFPEGFKILCHNCNFSKHKNGGICIHKLSTVKPIVV
jgi:hypothetical protein